MGHVRLLTSQKSVTSDGDIFGNLTLTIEPFSIFCAWLFKIPINHAVSSKTTGAVLALSLSLSLSFFFYLSLSLPPSHEVSSYLCKSLRHSSLMHPRSSKHLKTWRSASFPSVLCTSTLATHLVTWVSSLFSQILKGQDKDATKWDKSSRDKSKQWR